VAYPQQAANGEDVTEADNATIAGSLCGGGAPSSIL